MNDEKTTAAAAIDQKKKRANQQAHRTNNNNKVDRKPIDYASHSWRVDEPYEVHHKP